jgi:hypothetical protein
MGAYHFLAYTSEGSEIGSRKVAKAQRKKFGDCFSLRLQTVESMNIDGQCFELRSSGI